jgi:hypothetical protein
MTLILACRRYRLRDIGLLRRGAASAGHELQVMVLPWALPMLVLAALRRLLGRRTWLILSDKLPGDTLIARLFGRHAVRMLWNYADEWPAAGTRVPTRRVCFFEEAGHDVEIFPFAPQPQPRPEPARADPVRPIVFVGDVTAEFAITRGSAWWRARFRELYEEHGCVFYLRAEYEELIERELTLPVERRLARVLAKNLLRLWIVEAVDNHFRERLTLIGSNWKRFGLRCEPSAYDERARLQLYRSAIVNLDCGSKSGSGVIYPRSSELISYAGGLLQVRCSDTDAVFGELAAELSFDSAAQAIQRIEARLAEPARQRAEREARLAARLRERRLLMQHSFERTFDPTRRPGQC